MARNTGSEGQGFSKPIETTETQNTTRRAAKAGRRRGKHGGGETSDVPLLDAVQQDRQAARHEAIIDRAFQKTLSFLQGFGNQPVSGLGMRPRWSVSGHGAANEIKDRELMTGDRMVAEVRRRFASACHFDPRVQETPGQEQSWFPAFLEETTQFHALRRAAKQAARSVPDAAEQTVTATSDELTSA